MDITSNDAPDTADPLLDRLAETYAELRDRVAELSAAAERVPPTLDDTTHERAIGFVAQMKAAIKKADTARKAEKDDFLQAGRKVDGFFAALTDSLTAATKAVEAKVTAYLRAKADEERRRREAEEKAAREEAARRAAEMQTDEDLTAAVAAETQVALAAKAAVAKPADLARTHTAHGAMATLTRHWTFETEDWTQIDLNALRAHFAVAAVDQAIRGFIKNGGRELRGVRIFQEERALVR